jgi:hypothetical protein
MSPVESQPYPELTNRDASSEKPLPESHARFACVLTRTALARDSLARDRHELLRLWRVFVDAVEAECRGIPETRLPSLHWSGFTLLFGGHPARSAVPSTAKEISSCVDDATSLLDIAHGLANDEISLISSLAAALPIDPIPF